MLNVDEVQPMTIVLLGEITHPGVVTLEPATGLAHAIAVGGGLTDYASRDRIFVLRQQPKPMRIRFTYEALTHDEDRAATFPLRTGDVVVVE
jgi:polysaccharide export outer membrane protein